MKIDWRRPVETVQGLRLNVVRPGFVKGLPPMPDIGRYGGPDVEWEYPNTGEAANGFLPDIRNVME